MFKLPMCATGRYATDGLQRERDEATSCQSLHNTSLSDVIETSLETSLETETVYLVLHCVENSSV